MKTQIARFDMHYEVVFSRPAFSHLASFSQIIEPIYDAFSADFPIPSDAIKLEDGNTIATAGVTLTLFSGLSVFEARLDGYKADILNLRTTEDFDQAKRHTTFFESAILGFLTDGIPKRWRLVTPYWLTVEEGMDAVGHLIRRLTWLPESHDPFEISSNKVDSQVRFDCSNTEDQWTARITVDKSAIPNAHLFLEISSQYETDSHFNNFDKRTEHLSMVTKSVIDKLGLVVE
ncbi:MAG: hypothetical protein OXC84_15050 [Gammaproteobacteria bacterium]|nr:hypothetical protein [Gammaproteobacteria bacterium]